MTIKVEDSTLAVVRAFERMGIEHDVTGSLASSLERDDPFSSVKVASACDVLLSKLRWYRLGGEISDQQWKDVLGTLDLLERVLSEAST
ncbi:MAG: hypothetical protein Q8L48_37945 [Archangium sp.]|nr:hypothetical protein [Archangium sp.]